MNTFLSGIKNLFLHLCRFWWVFALAFLLGLSLAVLAFTATDPVFHSRTRLHEPVRLRLPEDSTFTEDAASNVATQVELLKCDALRHRALERLRTTKGDVPVPRGADGDPLPVELKVLSGPRSRVLTVEAYSVDSAYTQAYLDALVGAYLEFKRESRKQVSGESLNSVAELVYRAQKNLDAKQEALSRFRQENNLDLLEQDPRIAETAFSHLNARLMDLRIEHALADNALQNAVGSDSNSPVAKTNPAVGPLVAAGSLSPDLAASRPKDLHTGEQLVAYRTSLGQAINLLEALRREFLTNAAAGASVVEQHERLRANVKREQAKLDRLADLLEQIEISRNIDHQALAVLEPATPPKRSYAKQIRISVVCVSSAICLGFLIVLLLWVFKGRSIRSQPSPAVDAMAQA